MPSGSISVDQGGKNVSTGWQISGDKWSIKQKVSGELQDFNIDSKQSATSIPVDVVDNLDNSYTATLATGDITGLTTELSGDIKIHYTVYD